MILKRNTAGNTVYIMWVSEQFESSELAGRAVEVDSEVDTNSRTLHAITVMCLDPYQQNKRRMGAV
jgi:hypothetical protein